MVRLVVLLSVLLALPGLARAEDPYLTPKSEKTAQGLAIGGTLGSAALLFVGAASDNPSLSLTGAAGLLFLPSMGHWYAGEVDATGLGLRLGGTAVGTIGLIMIVSTIEIGDDSETEEDERRGDAGLALLATGSVMYLGGVAYSWLTADDAARAHNERLQIVPVATSTMAGVAVSGRF